MSNVAAKRRPSMAVTAALLLLAAMSACGTSAASTTVQPGPPDCPNAFVEDARPATTTDRAGQLVPDGAAQALLCVFPFAGERTDGVHPLGKAISLPSAQVNRLVVYLNKLARTNPATNYSCNLMGHDQYQISLGYPNSTNVVVRVDYNCGLASSEGAVRQLDRADTLLAFWPERP